MNYIEININGIIKDKECFLKRCKTCNKFISLKTNKCNKCKSSLNIKEYYKTCKVLNFDELREILSKNSILLRDYQISKNWNY